jgi:molecular chaperone GrpE
MGLEAARAESASSMLFMGMNMVFKQIENFLAEMNVTDVPAQDLPFDPNLHEAVSQEAHDSAPEGQVLRILRKGYKLKDRLLRPAMVVVSKGPDEVAPIEA